MSTKTSITALKGMIRKPTSEVTIVMMNKAIADRNVNKKPSYKLSDLLAEMDINEPIPEDIKAWMEMKPVGKEIL